MIGRGCMNRAMPPKRLQKPRKLRPTYLRAWRLFRGLTQEQAAERVNLSYTTLGKIERGLVPYSQSLLESAAEAYRCEPWELLYKDPTKEGRVIDLADILRGAPPELQAEIIGYARGRLGKQ